MSDGVVLIGGGQASAVAARTLRRLGYAEPVTIIGAEPELPYQRPPLSKEYLVGGSTDDLWLITEDWARAKEVTLLPATTVERIDPTGRSVVLADGRRIPADHVMIGTGGRARTLPAATGDRIVTLRSRADADRLRELITPGASVVIIGAGFIGSEIASSARTRGAKVTMVEAGPVPLLAAVGEEIGKACAALHARHDVDLHLDTLVSSVVQHGEQVEVRTAGPTLLADVVVIGIGMVPNVEIATASGLQVDDGILVDEHGRTSNPNVWAAGDVANHWHPLFERRMRVEHFDNASKQAAVVAKNIIGRSTIHDDPHWFWSDQYDANLQYVGHRLPDDAVIRRGSPDSDEWSFFYQSASGALHAAFAMNQPETISLARELISMQLPVDAALLGDPDTDLMSLMEDM